VPFLNTQDCFRALEHLKKNMRAGKNDDKMSFCQYVYELLLSIQY